MRRRRVPEIPLRPMRASPKSPQQQIDPPQQTQQLEAAHGAVDETAWARSPRTLQEHQEAGMLPLYAARIEDLGQGDFVKVDCAACHHVALLTPEALLRVGLSRAAKVLDLKGRFRCRGCGRKGRAVVSIKWRAQSA